MPTHALRLFILFASLISIHAQHPWQQPKRLVPKATLEKLIGPLSAEAPSKELKITWVWGYDANHRPGAHDYLKVRDLMTGLLKSVPKVAVDTAYHFPSKEQLEQADLLVMYLHLPQLTDGQYSDFKSYIARGGGVVALHETAIIRPASEGQKLASCLGMAWNEGPSHWGAIFEDISIENEHAIFQGFPDKLRIVDEFYWNLIEHKDVKILGTVRTGPAGRSRGPLPEEKLSKERSPMFWTLESGKGRVFGTTTGHNTFTYYDPEFRIVLFRAIAWTMNEKPDPFMPLVYEGITNSERMVGTTDTMRDWKGKLRRPSGK